MVTPETRNDVVQREQARRRMIAAPVEKEEHMGNPVVHFEVVGKDGTKLQKF